MVQPHINPYRHSLVIRKWRGKKFLPRPKDLYTYLDFTPLGVLQYYTSVWEGSVIDKNRLNGGNVFPYEPDFTCAKYALRRIQELLIREHRGYY